MKALKTFRITFEFERKDDPDIPKCRKAVVWMRSETAHGAEDQARFRFDFTVGWRVTETVEEE